jgi:hypothetical protein
VDVPFVLPFVREWLTALEVDASAKSITPIVGTVDSLDLT